MNIYIFTQSSSFFYIGMSIAKLRRKKNHISQEREGKGKIKKEEGKIIYSPGRGQKQGRPVTGVPTLLY